jgi:hypothetical protein
VSATKDAQGGDHGLGAPDDTVLEHALLIARGVRPMALVDVLHIVSVESANRVHWQLSLFASRAGDCVLPFVVRSESDGLSYCGFAAAKWVIDLLHFAVSGTNPHKHPIIGLLLGYSAVAIQRHEDMAYRSPVEANDANRP